MTTKKTGTDAEAGYREALADAKAKSTAQLLFRCARRVNEVALARVRRRAGVALRATHTSLFPHVDLAGTRQTELARRLGITRQAVHQLVGELEALGVLERVADPGDARATLVRFTRKGRAGLLDGLALLGELEAEMARALGATRMDALHDALAALDAWLDAPPGATPDGPGVTRRTRRR